MKKLLLQCRPVIFIILSLIPLSCLKKKASPSEVVIQDMNLKRGAVISCGPSDQQFGSVAFEISSRKNLQSDFNFAISLLHSFEYDEAEKVFAKIIDEYPDCAMAYWGVAMANFHPLWTPPAEPELEKGAKAIAIAQSLAPKTKREDYYINAIAAFYQNWDKVDHKTRCLHFEKGMEYLYTKYPNDKEAAIFYALALNAAADPADKSFKKQKKAGSILAALYPDEPNHPGIVHYLIHTYDYPELATLALPAARKYASVAPSSAHALHMPSHIFTRLGLWGESIQSNLESVASAQCYAQQAGMKEHWDEEIHGLDYLVYGYLQTGDNKRAKEQWDYLKTIKEVYPVNFKVAYAFAAIPARYVLENKQWDEAADLQSHAADFQWQDYPWQKAIIHFTRLLGLVHLGNTASAHTELKELQQIYSTLTEQKDSYKANQVHIQLKAAEAWLRFKEGKKKEALALMNAAADLEDLTEKHPVTPGEVIPARELLGEMLLQMNQPDQALAAFEANLKKHPNRFNGLYGAGQAAEKSGNPEKATFYYRHLIAIVGNVKSNRPELTTIKLFLNKTGSVI